MNAKRSKLLQQIVNGLLITIALGLLGVLSVRYKVELDWTAGHRNTLTEASRKLLAQMHDPVHFIVFDDLSSENRPGVQMWVDRYKRFKPDIDVSFVDPSRDPAKVKQYSIDQRGELVVEYQNRHETLRALSETLVTGALQRLMDSSEHYVVFLEGHGEHSINPTNSEYSSQVDYDQFVQALREKGLKVQGLNLIKSPSIPDNTSVLVIASPTQKLLDGEIKIVDDYVKAGGNLLWLNDPEQPTGLDAVAKTLGFTWLNGYAVFPDYQALGTGSPSIYLAANYPPNPVTEGFTEITAYPLVRPVDWDKDADRAAGWDVLPLLETNDSSWLETGPATQTTITFDEKKGDKPGPLTIGLTMTRQVQPPAAAKDDKTAASKPARSQRVAIIGDSDFLTDAFLTFAPGNKLLGLNVIQWLAARDAQLNIDVPKAPDVSLYLPGWAGWLITAGFIGLLPLLLIGYGALRWVRRRRS
ncbi:MAG: GldG family protein [Nevskia sp.]|nr:GldG family protein [Nevskia sp.]